MNDVMAIIELWINASRSVQEVDMKLELIERKLFEIKQEKKRSLENGKRDYKN